MKFRKQHKTKGKKGTLPELSVNTFVKLISETSTLNEDPIACPGCLASQHYGYEYLGGQKLHNRIDYATVPMEPMDIYGELIRLMMLSGGNPQGKFSSVQFKMKIHHARIALASSALILSPAVHGIRENAYHMRDDIRQASAADKELQIRNGTLVIMRDKIESHLKRQNSKQNHREQPQKKQSKEYELLWDFGIMVWKQGKNYYVSSVAQMLHIKALVSVDDYVDKEDTKEEIPDPVNINITKGSKERFEVAVMMGIMQKGLARRPNEN